MSVAVAESIEGEKIPGGAADSAKRATDTT